MAYRVGSVPYLNSKPLVKPLEWVGKVFVDYAVPSQLPALLDSGKVDAVLVSSIHALKNAGGRIASGLSIGTQDEVISVRLLSKVEPSKIETLALDASSLTSNALAEILLAERFGRRVSTVIRPPNEKQMLSESDACVMIGDNGMAAKAEGLFELDLGREWRALTGLPFVWAVWLGGGGLDGGLVAHLQSAMQYSRENWPQIIEAAAAETGFPTAECRHYLIEVMDYRLTREHLDGLREFGRLAVEHRILERVSMPDLVEAAPVFSEAPPRFAESAPGGC